MKKRLFMSGVLASLLMGTISLSANAETERSKTLVDSTQKSQKIVRIQKSIKQEIKHQKDDFKEASKEIMSGLKKTFLATRLLENNKVDEAKKSLDESIKLFETALSSEPELGLIPIAQEINVHFFGGSSKELQSYLDVTVALLKEHNIQKARAMLLPLEDEMIIATQRLPIGAYLESTKEAKKLLNANKKDEALSTLLTGLSLMEMDTVVMPIPLIIAEDALVEASLLDKSNKEEAQKLLAIAQDELKKALLLGYTQKHSLEYKDLSTAISEIQKEIKGKNVVEKLYDNVKEKFHSLLSKSRKDVVKQKAEEKVHSYQNQEAKKAINETSTFEKDAKADENKVVK
jgi:hypothetical protein